MTCDHTEGDLVAFIELRRAGDEYKAIGFLTGSVHPEVIVEGTEFPDEALISAGYELGIPVEVAEG